LSAERRIQVLAHHQLLERGGLAERPDQGLAVLEDHRRLARRRTATGGEEVHEPAARRRRRRQVGPRRDSTRIPPVAPGSWFGG
jgi:hypothetical protein